MATDISTEGVVLLCDPAGVITKVLQNTLGVADTDLVGKSFPQLVDPSSMQKAFSFLVSLRGNGAVFGWELDMPLGGHVVLALCAGLVLDGDLLIMAARSQADIQHLFDQMMIINNEQMSLLRKLTSEQARLDRIHPDRDIKFYEELTRLNNELVTLQRDLVRKNAELEQLNAEVQRLAVTDPLTGLYNRRGFFALGEREAERAQRYNHPLAVIMLDLDHFKAINDLYGHETGDLVLEKVAERCRAQLRKVDIIGRYGGEEFSILLPETDIREALDAAERLRRAIADEPVEANHGVLHVTTSIGLAIFQDASMTLDQALRLADQALYQAKQSGRNQVSLYEGGMPNIEAS